MQVVVGAARHDAEALGGERVGERLRVAHDVGRVRAELGLHRLVERDRLRRDHVHERAALQTREHRLVDRGRVARRGRGSHPRAGRAASCAS